MCHTDGAIRKCVANSIRGLVEVKKIQRKSELGTETEICKQEPSKIGGWIRSSQGDEAIFIGHRLLVSQNANEVYLTFGNADEGYSEYLKADEHPECLEYFRQRDNEGDMPPDGQHIPQAKRQTCPLSRAKIRYVIMSSHWPNNESGHVNILRRNEHRVYGVHSNGSRRHAFTTAQITRMVESRQQAPQGEEMAREIAEMANPDLSTLPDDMSLEQIGIYQDFIFIIRQTGEPNWGAPAHRLSATSSAKCH